MPPPPIALGRGRLLVATPELQDPNFTGTVILLLEHGDDGTVGVVLNRPSELRVPDALGDAPGGGPLRWDELVGDVGVVHVGGPVQPNAVIALGRPVPEDTRAPEIQEDDAEDDGPWQHVFADVGVIGLDEAPLDAIRPIEQLRVYAGYSGWAPGQLDDEIAEGAWFVVGAAPGDPFSDEPDVLWRAVLRRQGGLFTTVTPNPALN